MEVFHDGFLLADDPMSAEQFHQEYNPPVEGSYTGMNQQEKIVPVTDRSLVRLSSSSQVQLK